MAFHTAQMDPMNTVVVGDVSVNLISLCATMDVALIAFGVVMEKTIVMTTLMKKVVMLSQEMLHADMMNSNVEVVTAFQKHSIVMIQMIAAMVLMKLDAVSRWYFNNNKFLTYFYCFSGPCCNSSTSS